MQSSALCEFLEIIYSPLQSNEIVKKFNCQLKVSLLARLPGSDWFHHLPLVLLGLQSVPRED